MLYKFVERRDDGTKVIATAEVIDGRVTWKGDEVQETRTFLRESTWRRLGDKSFDESQPAHWEILPEMITGTRFWVEAVG